MLFAKLKEGKPHENDFPFYIIPQPNTSLSVSNKTQTLIVTVSSLIFYSNTQLS